jgi:hypothetical protein
VNGSRLSWVNLSGADLSGADLSDVNLSDVNLNGANLSDVDLSGANLSWANLNGANLNGADLNGTDLYAANLSRANLSRTYIDPNNKPNAEVTGFQRDADGFIIGFRTRKTSHIDEYRDGRCYSADWFSTAATECHPGLYLWPTLDASRGYSGVNAEIIRVRTKPECVHHAGDKWRCQWFEVLGSV